MFRNGRRVEWVAAAVLAGEGRDGGGVLSDVSPFHPFTQDDATAAECVDSGFSCHFAYGQTCQSVAGYYATVPVATCSDGQRGFATDLRVPYTITETSTSTLTSTAESLVVSTTLLGTYEVYAPLIDIRWQASDKPASGLSTGGKAAIGVVVPVAVVAMVVGAFFLWRKRRKVPREKGGLPELPGGGRDKIELDGNVVHELEDERVTQEMGSKSTPWHERHEVQGSQPELAQLPG